jgi:poly(3-hydroxybutyrate) depolymerase
MDGYLIVFPEADSRLSDEWVHFGAGDSTFPTYDLLFVEQLLAEITAAQYPTGSAMVPYVTIDPALVYAAGFSNGGGMVWQLMNSALVADFRGFAAVAKVLDPEKVQHYRRILGAGVLPAPVPAVYVHGTADTGFGPKMNAPGTSLDTTLPAYTVEEMLRRNNLLPPGSHPPNVQAATTLVSGSTSITEVVIQLFQAGNEAFEYVTVVGGGHNWPTPTTRGNPPIADHFDATQEIVGFWHNHAGLP